MMPSMAFKLGLYQAALTVGEARAHGNFGVGQFAALDGELTVVDGEFYRALADGSVRLAGDDDPLCFAQLTYFEPTEEWACGPCADEGEFETLLRAKLPFPNDFWAFQVTGKFAAIVPTTPPKLAEPYPPFAQAVAFRKSFAASDVTGTVVGFYSPAFAADTGIPGFHYHLISADRRLSGHVTSFSLAYGCVKVARLRETVLRLPETPEFAEALFDTPPH